MLCFFSCLINVKIFCQAKERREGDNRDYEGVDEFAATANYRAVGPTAEATYV